jgi:hypothetical protein
LVKSVNKLDNYFLIKEFSYCYFDTQLKLGKIPS